MRGSRQSPRGRLGGGGFALPRSAQQHTIAEAGGRELESPCSEVIVLLEIVLRVRMSKARSELSLPRTVLEAGRRQVALLDVAHGDGHPRPPLRPVPHALAELLDRAVQVDVRRLCPLVRIVGRCLRAHPASGGHSAFSFVPGAVWGRPQGDAATDKRSRFLRLAWRSQHAAILAATTTAHSTASHGLLSHDLHQRSSRPHTCRRLVRHGLGNG